MAKKDIVNYVRKYHKGGYTIKEIREALLVQDCKEEDIVAAFKATKIDFKKEEKEQKDSLPDKPDGEPNVCKNHSDKKAKKKPKKLSMKQKLLPFVIFIVFFAGAVALLILSGIEFDLLLTPMDSSSKAIKGNIPIDLVFIIGFVLCFLISMTVISYYALRFKEFDKWLISLPFISAVIVVVFGKFTNHAIFMAIGILFSLFLFMWNIKRRKELYKKISWYETSTKAFGLSFIFFTLMLSLVVMTLLMMDQSYADKELESIFQYSGYGGDIDDIEKQLKEEEKKASYAFLEAIEASLILSIDAHPNFTSIQKKNCMPLINSSMMLIDKAAKESIDRKLDEASLNPMQEKSLENAKSLQKTLKEYFPYFVGITLFFALEFIKKLVEIILGFYCFLISLLLPKDLKLDEEGEDSSIVEEETDIKDKL